MKRDTRRNALKVSRFARNIEWCARCGGAHRRLKLRKMERPIKLPGRSRFTHWMRCPATGDPILVEIVASNKAQ